MSRVTAALMMIGLTTLALQAHADDAWFDASARNVCSVITSIDDRDHQTSVKVGWQRGSKGPTVILMPPAKTFAHGGSISIESPSLGHPWPLAAEDHFTASGPQLDLLLKDMAAGKNWSLVLHPSGGTERRVNQQVGNAERAFAMFDACRGVRSRAAAPAAVEGQVRAKGFQPQAFGSTCELTALFHWGANDLVLKLTRRDATTIVKVLPSEEHPSVHLDLTSLGGSADVAWADVSDVTLSDVSANLLVTNLLAGKERLIPVRALGEASTALVLGGPEFAVESAMFKACIDVH